MSHRTVVLLAGDQGKPRMADKPVHASPASDPDTRHDFNGHPRKVVPKSPDHQRKALGYSES
jgi:hypothetical protein